jgi:hypothetical protein
MLSVETTPSVVILTRGLLPVVSRVLYIKIPHSIHEDALGIGEADTVRIQQ